MSYSKAELIQDIKEIDPLDPAIAQCPPAFLAVVLELLLEYIDDLEISEAIQSAAWRILKVSSVLPN